MIVLLRFLVVMLIAQTIVYLCILAFARAQRRARLAEEWAAQDVDRDEAAFVARGMEAYEASLRRRMLYGIYVVPLALVMVLVYVTNFM